MKYLICYDGSAAAKKALLKACEQAEPAGAKLYVVKAIEREEPLRHAFIVKSEEEMAAEVGALLEGKRVAYEPHLLVNSLTPAEQLVKFARAKKIELLYIGIRKRSKVGKLLFGSTAQFVILNAPCPVVSVATERK
jgi:nucleotide-binding universal stress UspA family protein